MVKKVVKFFIIIAAIVAVICISMMKVYAFDEEKISFISVDSNDVVAGEIAYLKIDLSVVAYDSFSIEVNASKEISEPALVDGESGEKISGVENSIVDKKDINNNEIENNLITDNIVDDDNSAVNNYKFTISNINNLKELILQIQIPENICAGDKITINIKVADTNNSENAMNGEIVFNIVNGNSDNNNGQNEEVDNGTDKEQLNGQDAINSGSGMSQLTQSLNTSTIKATTTSSTGMSTMSGGTSSEQTVTYNGSNDNYLDNIYIDGEAVSENFNKTKTTYFKTVDSADISISYDKNDTNSTVCIYGNSDLKTGRNKVLITVTAEDGSTRNYRVYVTVE